MEGVSLVDGGGVCVVRLHGRDADSVSQRILRIGNQCVPHGVHVPLFRAHSLRRRDVCRTEHQHGSFHVHVVNSLFRQS